MTATFRSYCRVGTLASMVLLQLIGVFDLEAHSDRPTEGDSVNSTAPIPPVDMSSPEKCAPSFSALFSSLSDADLGHFVADTEDVSLALAGAWERVRRSVPLERGELSAVPRESDIYRFLGLLEGRTRYRIPAEWEELFVQAESYGRAYFRFPQLRRPDSNTHRTKAGLLAPVGVTAKRNEENLILSCGDASVTLSESAARKRGPVDAVALARRDMLWFVALYSDRGSPYTLEAVDSTKQTLWRARVWASGGLTNYSGRGWHRVTVQLCDQDVVVFGVADDCAYVESFDAQSGEPRLRFSTALLGRSDLEAK